MYVSGGPAGQYQGQGPQYAGAPGSGQRYAPGQQQYRGGPSGPGSQQYADGQQYQGGPGGPMGEYGAPGQQYAVGPGPGGKQVYSTSSEEWDGDKYTTKAFRQETESHYEGSRSYSQTSTSQVLRPAWRVKFVV